MTLASTLLSSAWSGGGDYSYTHFHAQPLKNWLNDPNGMMYFNDVYHLFFQYNPDDFNWGNMHWYHMTSTDMLHWKHQPIALAPDQDYDCGGIFSGSATIVRGVPVLSYSVACGESIVNAIPSDVDDPNLVNWTKPSYNPVIPLPPSVTGGFRDPTTAWQGADKVWRLLVGCGDGEGTCEFKSIDFVSWTYVGAFHSHGGGMWECPDFFRLPGTDAWVLKASTSCEEDHRPTAAAQKQVGCDWFTVGTYTEVADPTKADVFVPASGYDIREGRQLLDFGNLYAAKAFYDAPGDRSILFGWVNYHCDATDWSGIQTLPRVVQLDPANGSKIVSFPLPELVHLYDGAMTNSTITLEPGASKSLGRGTQLDVHLAVHLEVSRAGGLAGSSIALGVTALGSGDGQRGKRVTIGSSTSDAGVVTGTLISDAFEKPFEAPFVVAEPTLTLRLLIDHSVVEAYAQGGRAVATLPYCAPSAEDDNLAIANHGDAPVTIVVGLAKVQTANVLPSD